MSEYLAFDIGGTCTKYGVIKIKNRKTEIIEHYTINTPKTLEKLINVITNFSRKRSSAVGITISSPGAVSETGIIYGASALDYLHGPNIKNIVSNKTGLSVHIENDANCALCAEMWEGNGLNNEDAMMIVIGTGVGGAIVKNRKLHKGANLHSGEFGYMLFSDVETNDWIRMDSTKALIRNVENKKGMKKGELTGEEVFSSAKLGDKDCIQYINRFYRLLSMGIFNLQYIYDPEVILIGGGISSNEDLIININKRIDAILEDFPKAKIRPIVKSAYFRQYANLIGSVYCFIKEGEI